MEKEKEKVFKALKIVDIEKALDEALEEDEKGPNVESDKEKNGGYVETAEEKLQAIEAVKENIRKDYEQSVGSGQEGAVGLKESQADAFFDRLVKQSNEAGQLNGLYANYLKLKANIQNLPSNFEEKTRMPFSLKNLKTVKYEPRRYEFEALRDYYKNGSLNPKIDHSVFGISISNGEIQQSDRVQLLKELGYEGDYVNIASNYFREEKRPFYKPKKHPLSSTYDIVIEGVKSTNPDNPEFDLRIINRGENVFPFIYLIPRISEDGNDLVTELLTKPKE